MRPKKSEEVTVATTSRPPLEVLVDFDARAEAAPAPQLAYGTVSPAAELSVIVDGRTLPARRAKSCLVTATAGDRVLCVVEGSTACVLAVLDGAPDTRLAADGKLEVHAEDLSLTGARVAVRASRVDLVADGLEMRAKSAIAALDELRVLGRTIEVSVADRAALFAERVETRASRLLQRTKQLFRFVEDVEQSRVGNYDLRAEGLAAVRGENTIMTARVLAKLDGEQVKIG